jgi:hypothetical protein
MNTDNPQQAVLAYMAGIVDGEGTITVRCSSSYIFQAELLVSSTSQVLIGWIDEHFEGGLSRTVSTNVVGRPRNWKPCMRWQLNGQKALPLVKDMFPYLVIKKHHAELFIEFLETCSPGKGKMPTEYQKARREEIIYEFRDLNMRGRAVAETE